jgi:hypothetical protein
MTRQSSDGKTIHTYIKLDTSVTPTKKKEQM